MSKGEIWALCVFSFIVGQFVAIAIIAFFVGATKNDKTDDIPEKIPKNVTPFRRL